MPTDEDNATDEDEALPVSETTTKRFRVTLSYPDEHRGLILKRLEINSPE